MRKPHPAFGHICKFIITFCCILCRFRRPAMLTCTFIICLCYTASCIYICIHMCIYRHGEDHDLLLLCVCVCVDKSKQSKRTKGKKRDAGMSCKFWAAVLDTLFAWYNNNNNNQQHRHERAMLCRMHTALACVCTRMIVPYECVRVL